MKKLFLFFVPLTMIGALLGAGFAWYKIAIRPLSPLGSDMLITIKPGLSSRSIGQKLQTEGIIKSEIAFYINVRLHDDLLQAGTYILSPALSVDQVITKMATGDVAVHRFTIPEGWRLAEIAHQLETKKIVSGQDFLKAAEGKEGYLFPDTYTFPLNVTAAEIVIRMRQNFDTRTNTAGLTLKRADIILASIVEREAKNDDERASIAAVYLNRMRMGMRLDADPTVQYAKTLVDATTAEFWPKITTADYRSVQSPYNTYVNNGLPPGPICSPGIASLRAVLNPASIEAIYFFHTSDGQTIFSKTLDEHNAKKKQHNLAI